MPKRPSSYQGIASKQTFKKIKFDSVTPTLDLANPVFFDCCMQLCVLGGIGEQENDITGFLVFVDETATSELFLEQKIGGNWVEQAPIVDNTLGDYFPLGFDTNKFDKKMHGVQFDWYKVLSNYGQGCFRIKHVSSNLTGTKPNEYSFEFNLLPYSASAADGTVRIDYTLQGQIGDPYNDELKVHYGKTFWKSQLRLKAEFGFSRGEFEEEYIRFENGRQVMESQLEKDIYKMDIDPISNELHLFIRKRILQADQIFITDYNTQNREEHIKRLVISVGNYEPIYTPNFKLSPVEIEFEQGYQNNVRRRC